MREYYVGFVGFVGFFPSFCRRINIFFFVGYYFSLFFFVFPSPTDTFHECVEFSGLALKLMSIYRCCCTACIELLWFFFIPKPHTSSHTHKHSQLAYSSFRWRRPFYGRRVLCTPKCKARLTFVTIRTSSLVVIIVMSCLSLCGFHRMKPIFFSSSVNTLHI